MALTIIERNVQLDLYDHDLTPSKIKAIALDSKTRYVGAEIHNGGQTYDVGQNTGVTLTIIRPDKTGVQITGETFQYTVGDGETVYGAYAELTQTALAVSGTLLAQFMLTSGEQILRTEVFTINNGVALDATVSEWAGEYQGYNLDELVQNVNSAVATVGEMEQDVATLMEGLSDATKVFNEFAKTGESVVYSGTVSGTRAVVVDVNIPAGTYNLHIDNISSSDTDGDKSMIQYRYESGRLDKVYERGVEIDSTVTFTARVVQLAFLAAPTLGGSNGDSFTYSGVKLYTELFAKKKDLDATNVDIGELKEDLNSTKEELDNKVVYGQDIAFGDKVTGKYRTNGAYITDSTWLSSYTSILPCKPNYKYLYSGWAGINASDCPAALFYNANGDFLSSVSLTDNAFGYGIITIPNNVYGVRFQLAHRAIALAGTPSVTVIDPVMFDDIATETKALKNAYDKSELALAIAPTNLLDEIDKSDWTIGSLNVDTGDVVSNANFVTGYIPIKPHTVYSKSITGSVCVCDADRTYLGKSLIANRNYFYTNDARARYAKYSFRIDDYVSGNCYFKKYTAHDDVRTIEVTDATIDALANGGLLDVAGNDNFHFKKTNNLFNLNTTEWLYRMSIDTANGVPRPNLNPDGAISLMFIPVEDGDTICSNMAPWDYVLYNADKAFIGAGTPETLNKEDSVYICHVPIGSSASYMGITLKFNKDGGHGKDTDAPNGWIRSDAEISKVVIWKAQGEKLYPLDESVNRNSAFYKLLGDYVEPNYNALPDKDSEFFRMIRCEAIRAVNHTKHIYRIGCFNQYVIRKQYNWPHIKKMLADYGIDICGFNEAQYAKSQDAKASLGDYLKGWQFGFSASFYPLGTEESPYSNRDMVSFFPVVESEELFFPPDSRYGQYNNRSALRTKIKLPRYLDCTGGDQYLGFYVIHPTVAGTDLANLQKQEFQVCLDAMETDGCAFHIIAADSNAFDFDPNTHMPITWDWLVCKGFKLANDGLSKTVTAPSPDHKGSIDQIFVSSNINVLNWNVINGYDYAYTENSNAGYVPISDHDFVYADIEFDYSNVVTRLIPMTEIALIQTLDHVSSDTADNYHVPITRNQKGEAILENAVTVTLTADDGYTLSSVTVNVGGANKTSAYYSNGVVSIPAGALISGDIEIIASATELS